MSAVESFREVQVAQLGAVESLEVRAVARRELRDALEVQDREYALEWAAALKLDLTEGALTKAGLEAPNAPARSRVKVSRSKKVEQPVGGVGQGSSAG